MIATNRNRRGVSWYSRQYVRRFNMPETGLKHGLKASSWTATV
jgi:hypothetical protein